MKTKTILDKTINILDDVLLSLEKLKVYNEIIEDTTYRKIDGKGISGVNILYIMTENTSKEIKEIINKLDNIYKTLKY